MSINYEHGDITGKVPREIYDINRKSLEHSCMYHKGCGEGTPVPVWMYDLMTVLGALLIFFGITTQSYDHVWNDYIIL